MQTDPAKLKELFEPKEVKVLPTTRQVCSARFSPDGKFLCAGGFDQLIRRWDCSQEEHPELTPLTGHNGWVQEIAFHPAGEFLLSVDTWGKLCCWNHAAESPELKWENPAAHDGWITGLAISADGTQCATGGYDRKVRIWNTADGALLHEFSGHTEDVMSVLFHPNGQFVVSGDMHGTVHQFELASGNSVRTFDASVLFTLSRLQDVGGARCLQFNPDGTQLVVGGTKPANGGNVQGIPTLLVFDFASGELKQTLELGKSGDVYPYDVRFHKEGFLMIVISGNPGAGKLQFRTLDAEQPFFETTKMANCHSLSLHPDGYRIAVAATNGGSNGNGRPLKDGEYVGNHSPIYLLDLPRPMADAAAAASTAAP